MPMHNWSRVTAGTYHNFHYRWLAAIMDRLNGGVLPKDFIAMAEQILHGPEADVVTLHTGPGLADKGSNGAAVAVAPPQPQTRFVLSTSTEAELYARKADQIVIRHTLGEVVAVIEVVSPGNKDRKNAFQRFIDKTLQLLQQGIHLLIVDPFRPGKHDPQGVHAAIWSAFSDEPFALPADKPLTMVAYQVGVEMTAYVEPIAIGDPLPTMPVFLTPNRYVNLPLEDTYRATWDVLPQPLRQLVEEPG